MKSLKLRLLFYVASFLALGAFSLPLMAQPPQSVIQHTIDKLPEELEYQRTLRAYMATLTPMDFEIPALEVKPAAPTSVPDNEALYKSWLLSQQMPLLGAGTLPSQAFTLSAIEGKKGLAIPAQGWEAHQLAWLSDWDDKDNPYRGSKGLKMRAFVLATLDLVMLDWVLDHGPNGVDRADFLGGTLIWLGYTYKSVKDSLDPKTQKAFEEGLKRLVRKINKWGPTGLMTDMDLFAPVGLWYVADAVKDPEITKIAHDYSKVLFTDERYFHEAGYFVDMGCFDTSYNGISLYFGTWGALLTDWPWLKAAMQKASRLRAHLSFPDPDGSFTGPSAMNSRCSGPPPLDQWQFSPRMQMGWSFSDDGVYLSKLPTQEELNAAPGLVASSINSQMAAKRELKPEAWKEWHWSRGVNYAHEAYRPGDYARRLKYVQENSPFLKPLYQRNENFIRAFEKIFLIAKFDGYGVAIHTGPVGGLDKRWTRPYGHGGGELSAFWTPKSGSVMLARRRGIQGHTFDSLDEWRIWPIHAVTGLTGADELISSGRIKQPETHYNIEKEKAHVHVTGVMPRLPKDAKQFVDSKTGYERAFDISSAGLTVTTTVTFSADEPIKELYETIPLFLRENDAQKAGVIEFQVDGKWVEATPAAVKITGARIKRFEGAVVVAFPQAVTGRLSPAVWKDGYQTQAECRTLLVDIPVAVSGKATVKYTIAAE